jgi:hypothetical protein
VFRLLFLGLLVLDVGVCRGKKGSSGKCVPTLMKTEEFEDEEVLISIAIHLAI